MSNPLYPTIVQGCLGELLVQIRLLQFGVQAAPPLKDSGNDLIAVRCKSFQSIQIKTTTDDTYSVAKLPDFYDLLAVVQLAGEEANVRLDNSSIFLIRKHELSNVPRCISKLDKSFMLSADRIDELFGKRHHEYYPEIAPLVE
jgi:hypothetical protein